MSRQSLFKVLTVLQLRHSGSCSIELKVLTKHTENLLSSYLPEVPLFFWSFLHYQIPIAAECYFCISTVLLYLNGCIWEHIDKVAFWIFQESPVEYVNSHVTAMKLYLWMLKRLLAQLRRILLREFSSVEVFLNLNWYERRVKDAVNYMRCLGLFGAICII